MRSRNKGRSHWGVATTLLLALSAALPTAAHSRERIMQLHEDGVTTRTLQAKTSVLSAANATRVCEAGAKWVRLDFKSLTLKSYDSLVLTSNGGDRYVFQGGHWNNRSFNARALRGSCVNIQPYFASPDSRYDVGGYTVGTQALAATTVTVAGAGDICDSTPADCKATSDLIVAINPTVVFTAGDNAYDSGTLTEYNNRYAPNWGRFKTLTRPTPGNHDYNTASASGYFDYFNGSGVQNGLAGDRAKGYYSYDVGDWHFVALNTMSSGSISTAQLDWLKSDLAANTKPCTAAYFHHPRWSTGNYTGYTGVQSAYTELYAAKADLILVGHDHNYQRSKKINASGAVAADGFRQFLVGTGGRDFYPFGSTNTTVAEVRNADTWGVLKLTLSATGYTADFVPVAGRTFTDSVTGTCNKAVTGTTYSVSGTIATSAGAGISGVSVSNGSTSVTTNASGQYTFTGMANGTYTLTPSLSGYTFSPTSRSVTVSGANVTGANFTGTPPTNTTYSVSGTIATSAGAGISGVSVSNGSTSVTTNASGQYTFTGMANGTYTLTPSLSGYTFSPTSRSVTVSGANVTGANFTGTPPSSGGTVVLNVNLPSVASGSWSSAYPVSIPAGTTKLVVAISGGTGDADLYVRAGAVPSTSSYTCRPFLDGNTETCTINNPAAGSTYYVAVRAYSSYSGVNLKATRTP